MSKLLSGTKAIIRAFSYLGEARKRYLFGTLLASFELALLFATPVVNQMLIDTVTGERSGSLLAVLGMMFLLFLVFAPLVVAGKYFQSTAAAMGTANLRKTLFRKIMTLPAATQSQYKTGDFLTRMTDDAERTIRTFNSFAVICLVRFVVVFSITLILLLVNDWHIAVAGVIYGIISLILSVILNPYVKRLERDAKGEIVRSANFLIEALRGIPVVRIFTLYPALSEKYSRICGVIRKKKEKFTTVNGVTYGVIDFFTFSAQAVGFLIGVLLAGDDVALGEAVFNATLMGMMGDAMLRLSSFLLLIQPNLVAMERVFELMDQPGEDLSAQPQKINTSAGDAVAFRNVSFSYDGDKEVLDGLTFTLHRGEHLAIVGGSGGGKSTVIKLLEGFYQPTGGEISYFGTPGRSMKPAEIRGLFAYVPQECTLFDGTIGENIALGRPCATQAEIENAARMADLHGFIDSMPENYQTQVGERGGQLSGGQKQRIAIARAILKGAPILLLDEATAALDSAAEQEVQAYIDSISKTMTTVTVAHRLSTIRNADRILVIEGGKVVEEGGFDELLERGGRFRELWEIQQHSVYCVQEAEVK